MIDWDFEVPTLKPRSAALRLLRAIPLIGAVDSFDLAAQAGIDASRSAVTLLTLQRAGFALIRRGCVSLTPAGRHALRKLVHGAGAQLELVP